MACWSLAVTRHKTAADSNNKTKNINTIGASSSLSSSSTLEEEEEEEEEEDDDDRVDEDMARGNRTTAAANAD